MESEQTQTRCPHGVHPYPRLSSRACDSFPHYPGPLVQNIARAVAKDLKAEYDAVLLAPMTVRLICRSVLRPRVGAATARPS